MGDRVSTGLWSALAAVTVTCVGLAVPVAATTHRFTPTGYSALAGDTTLVAEQSSRAVVVLPKQVRLPTFSVGAMEGLRITGPGRTIGLALVSQDGRAGFVHLVFNSCWTRGCTKSMHDWGRQQLGGAWTPNPPSYGVGAVKDDVSLPAGLYVLSVFTDGAPVRIAWHLAGLAGRIHLRLRLPQHSQLATPAEHLAGAGPVTADAQAHATGAVGSNVQVLGFMHTTDSAPHVNSDVWWCLYDAPGPPGGVLAPYCPGGGGIGIGITEVVLSYKSMSYGYSVSAGPQSTAEVYQGVDDSGVQSLKAVHDNLFWANAGAPSQRGN